MPHALSAPAQCERGLTTPPTGPATAGAGSPASRHEPNYVVKPTAEEVARIIHTLPRGGGLTRR